MSTREQLSELLAAAHARVAELRDSVDQLSKASKSADLALDAAQKSLQSACDYSTALASAWALVPITDQSDG